MSTKTVGSSLPDLELFEELDMMLSVGGQIDAGYVDDPEFCMVRDESDLNAPGDDRLVFNRALFIAVAKIPGDDVFVALDLRAGNDDPTVLVFDWRRPVPSRWVAVGLLSDFVASLSDSHDGER